MSTKSKGRYGRVFLVLHFGLFSPTGLVNMIEIFHIVFHHINCVAELHRNLVLYCSIELGWIWWYQTSLYWTAQLWEMFEWSHLCWFGMMYISCTAMQENVKRYYWMQGRLCSVTIQCSCTTTWKKPQRPREMS